jgi:predicted PurR-regulated permease PerM
MISFANIGTILLVLTIFLFIIFYFLNNKHYKNTKFRSYVGIITAISTLVLAIGVLFQVVSYKIEEDKNTVQSFSSFSKDYVDSIIQIFSEHPEMNYYYDELFNGKINNYAKRNIVLENQLSMRIFAKTVEQISVIKVNENENISNANLIEETLLKILHIFFKSPTFKNYYIHYYKPQLAGEMMIEFMQEKFGF